MVFKNLVAIDHAFISLAVTLTRMFLSYTAFFFIIITSTASTELKYRMLADSYVPCEGIRSLNI